MKLFSLRCRVFSTAPKPPFDPKNRGPKPPIDPKMDNLPAPFDPKKSKYSVVRETANALTKIERKDAPAYLQDE